MEVFVQVREKQYLSDGQAGAQMASSPVGRVVLPQRRGARTYNDAGLAIDTARRHKTLTQHLGDTGEPRAALRLEDMSRRVATPMGRFNPHFRHVGQPGDAGGVIRQRTENRKTPAGDYQVPRLMDIQITGVSITESTCRPPTGRCTSCGIEGYRRLRAPCPARG